jgi:hypothetical protein
MTLRSGVAVSRLRNTKWKGCSQVESFPSHEFRLSSQLFFAGIGVLRERVAQFAVESGCAYCDVSDDREAGRW